MAHGAIKKIQFKFQIISQHENPYDDATSPKNTRNLKNSKAKEVFLVSSAEVIPHKFRVVSFPEKTWAQQNSSSVLNSSKSLYKMRPWLQHACGQNVHPA